jgi:hypothetical protein
MKKRVIIAILVIFFVLLFACAVIFYARGFSFNFQSKKIDHTGLLTITTKPEGAQVFLDGRLTSATNTTITYLKPKKYNLKLTKDGYNPWEKDIEIKADLTTEVEATLYPSIPELKPLTLTGADNLLASPDGNKLLYSTNDEKGAGLWILDMSSGPLPFKRTPHQIVKNAQDLNFSTIQATWSPDSQTIWVKIQINKAEGEENTRNFLLDAGKLNDKLVDVTATLESTLSSWQDEINKQEKLRIKKLEVVPDLEKQSQEALDKQTASNSASLGIVKYCPCDLIWSADERKVLIPKAQDGNFGEGATVWILKDTNPLIKTPDKFDIPPAKKTFWLPDSKHLVLVQEKEIQIIEFDGFNKVTVYSQNFENGYVFPWSDGSRLIILTTFNQSADASPNLYSINLD